jgi:hypothetical protein
MTAANALLRAIHQRLAGDAGLTALIGPDGIRDRLLPRPKLPAVVFGELQSRDLSTVTEPGEEHFVTLEIWSDGEGRRQVQEIAGRVDALLHDAALPLDEGVLVSLLRIGMRSRREPGAKSYLSEIRFRAVTE